MGVKTFVVHDSTSKKTTHPDKSARACLCEQPKSQHINSSFQTFNSVHSVTMHTHLSSFCFSIGVTLPPASASCSQMRYLSSCARDASILRPRSADMAVCRATPASGCRFMNAFSRCMFHAYTTILMHQMRGRKKRQPVQNKQIRLTAAVSASIS